MRSTRTGARRSGRVILTFLLIFGPVATACATPPATIATEFVPTVVIRWPTASGGEVRHEGQRPYRSAERHTYLGSNLTSFVAIGGTRVDKDAAHAQGTVLRVGFYKIRDSHPLFVDLADDARITIELRSIMVRDGELVTSTVIQHLQYGAEQARACGLGDTALDQFNTADPTETLTGVITSENGRPGGLAGDSPKAGRVSIQQEAGGLCTLIVEVPYAMFRHVDDPWIREAPGSFLEPRHLHVEIEARPVVQGRPRTEHD